MASALWSRRRLLKQVLHHSRCRAFGLTSGRYAETRCTAGTSKNVHFVLHGRSPAVRLKESANHEGRHDGRGPRAQEIRTRPASNPRGRNSIDSPRNKREWMWRSIEYGSEKLTWEGQMARLMWQMSCIVVVTLAGGCATFHPVATECPAWKERAKTVTDGDVTVRVAALTRKEANEALGFRLDRAGIQPVWVWSTVSRSAITFRRSPSTTSTTRRSRPRVPDMAGSPPTRTPASTSMCGRSGSPILSIPARPCRDSS